MWTILIKNSLLWPDMSEMRRRYSNVRKNGQDLFEVLEDWLHEGKYLSKWTCRNREMQYEVKNYCCHNIFRVTLTFSPNPFYQNRSVGCDGANRQWRDQTKVRVKKMNVRKWLWCLLRISWWAIFHALNFHIDLPQDHWYQSLSPSILRHTSFFPDQPFLSSKSLARVDIGGGGIISGHCASLPPFLDAGSIRQRTTKTNGACSFGARRLKDACP